LKKFKFSLESYLKTKEIEKDKTVEELALLNSSLRSIQENKTFLKNEMNCINSLKTKSLSLGVNSLYLSQIVYCFNELKENYNKEIQEEIKMKEKVSEKQDELKKVMGEIKGIEKLKEKQFEEFLENLKKESEKVTEEFLNSNTKNQDLRLSM